MATATLLALGTKGLDEPRQPGLAGVPTARPSGDIGRPKAPARPDVAGDFQAG
jgi:hypothetical protein